MMQEKPHFFVCLLLGGTKYQICTWANSRINMSAQYGTANVLLFAYNLSLSETGWKSLKRNFMAALNETKGFPFHMPPPKAFPEIVHQWCAVSYFKSRKLQRSCTPQQHSFVKLSPCGTFKIASGGRIRPILAAYRRVPFLTVDIIRIKTDKKES